MKFKFSPRIIFLFLAVVLFSGVFLYWIWDGFNQRKQEAMTSEQDAVKNQYSSTINSYRLVSKTLYDEVLNSAEVVNLVAAADQADTAGQQVIRQQLYDRLAPVFARLQQKNFKQLDFYLPDTTSFLNMQQPDSFGDKLGDIRASVKISTSQKIYVEGFEEGKSFNGFMFVFPLFQGNQYIGSVETSVSFNTFRNEMSLIFPYTYNFLIKKNVLTDQVFANEARNYFLSDLNRDYFYEKENDNIKRVDIVLPDQITAINSAVKDEAYPRMSQGELFTQTTTSANINYLVTFIPISDIKGDQVAYLVAYHRNDAVALLANDLTVKLIFTLSLALAMLFFIYYVNETQSRLLAVGEKLKNITAAMGEGLIVVNPDNKIAFFNEAAGKISGLTASQALNQEYSKVLHFTWENDNKRHDDFVRYVFRYNDVKLDNQIVLITAAGEKIPLAISAAPLRGQRGEVLGCIVVFRDITQEKEVDKAKTEFVSLASHQLKTPLSAVSWYSEMLSDETAGKLNDQQKDFIKEIREGNDRMIKLINGLLNVSRIDMGTLSISPEPVNLATEMDSVLTEQQFGIKAKRLQVVKKYDKTLPKINLDLNLIRIVLQNLLSNAVKYSRENGQISIEIKKFNAKEAYVAVTDNGYGIPKIQQPSIFKKLFRADNVKSMKVEGTGLGLYVAKAVVEAFGGKIDFKSEENKGTTFFFTLPLKGAPKKEGSKGLESNA
jgi:two-component system sensor histidine kinase/response regulator